MANTSEVISLPEGGGALSGLGEKFSPELHTGTGNFTVPITLPAGRNGFQPELNLVYSTGNGSGPFGLGWRLSVPGVHRKTSKGVPHYDDDRDTFILSGAEDLVPVEMNGSQTHYRPRTEGLFARIIHHHDAENDFWEVRSKDGLQSIYGTSAADRDETAVVANPAKRDQVFAWKLTRTQDSFGNRIEYEYERDSAEEDPHHWDQLYLRRIRYAGYEDALGQEQFLVSVTFEYGERPDSFSEYRSGFEIRTRRRCEQIVVRMHTEAEQLVRTYQLVYLDERVAAGELPGEMLPQNGATLLSQIKVTGHDGQETEMLPPLEFGYSRFEPEGRDFIPLEGALPNRSLESADLELADLTGNGLPDIFQMNGIVRYWSNLGDGRFGLPREMQDAPSGLMLTDPDVQLLDADGDARLDLMVTRNGISGYFPLRHDGEWDRRSYRRYRQAPSFNLMDPEVQLVDLDGDGVTDAVRSGTRLECFFNDSEEGWNETRFVPRRDIEDFPNVNFSDPRVKWADMTGDGLQDVVLVHDGNVEYWPNLGRGNWGRRISMRISPRFPYGYDPRRILIGDVDGDGAADLVYVDHCKVTLWINQSGNGWSDPIEIDGTPPVADLDSVRLVDALGTGIRGVLWSKDKRGHGRPHMFFLDFTAKVKPYLLNEMNNHLGAVTRVAYEPSTTFYLEDRRQRMDWKATLPFPVQVVSRVEVIDKISGGKLTTEYKYHHGYWDGAEREFRGFGMVEQLDTELFDDYDGAGLHEGVPFNRVDETRFAPPTLTKTWFHQGPVGKAHGDWQELDWTDEYWTGDPHVLQHPETVNRFLSNLRDRRDRRDALRSLRGSVLRTELYALDGSNSEDRPYTVTESSYGVREVDPPADTERRRIFFPHTLSQRTTQWERGHEPMTGFAFTGDYDAYGQPRSQISIAVPRGRNFRVADASSQPYFATHAVIDYAQKDNEEVYITGRTARTTTYEVLNDGSLPLFDLKERIADGTAPRRVIGQTLNFYDGPAFTGLPFGEIGEHGVLKRSEALVLTDEVLRDVYPDGDPTLTTADPPYFAHTGSPPWPDEYPQPFAASYPADQHADATRPGLKITPLGHGFADADPASPYEPSGYFVASQRLDHDPHGLVIAQRDPLGRDSADRDARIEYDSFKLLPVKVTDPAGLETKAEYDYRLLQPKRVTYPNHNIQAFTFSPLGLPTAVFVRGEDGEGDAVQPGTRFDYDLLAFENSPEDDRQPVWVRTIRREHHDSETNVPLPERDATLETVEYSDGFGRLVQTRTQAEDIIWGDDRIFGNGVLPLDQTDTHATNRPVGGHRRAAADPPNVLVSGWSTYDNKGQVVEQYEPFFAQGWDYLSREEAAALRDGGGPDLFGRKVTRFYDPRGQVIRTMNPDGSEQRVIYGVPGGIARPEVARRDRYCEVVFEPTPWEAYTYDANDNARCTHRQASGSYAHHWDTPSSIEIDALGRTVRTVERNRGSNPGDPIEEVVTRSTYDIRGNVLTVTDALNRRAFAYRYDLANQTLRIDSIDAGLRRIVLDAAGSEVERRDSKRGLVLQEYDRLNRPVRLWARDDQNGEATLRQRLEYGDGGHPNQPDPERNAARAKNRLGRLHRHYDEAGRLSVEAYDFKGNILEKARRVIKDERVADCFTRTGTNDWRADEDVLLEPEPYATSLAYDALNRTTSMRYPEDVDGRRAELRPHYNRAGALEQVRLDDDVYVERIAYNAKGQRTFIAYGNNIWTRYAYDPDTFRLKRLHSGRFTKPDERTYQPNGGKLQDFAYHYDLAGNILAILERVPGCGIRNNANTQGLPAGQPSFSDPGLPRLLASGDALFRRFEYDPLNRLTSATGRECRDIPSPRPWTDAPRCGSTPPNHGAANPHNAPDLTAFYTERYAYDPAGNMLTMRHARNVNGWTRHFGMGGFSPADWNREWQDHFRAASPWTDPPGNQLTHVGDNDPNTPQTHFFDPSGSLVRENTERHFIWNHSDQMRAFRIQAGSGDPTVEAHYLYDAGGQRVKKLVRRSDRLETTTYINEFFEHHRWDQGSERGTNNWLHVMDDQQRIALMRRGPAFANDANPGVQFNLDDHLGSKVMVVNKAGIFINREEYFPYGETSFGSFGRKRYRFTGKERDEESGLHYHCKRYYMSSTANWVSCDPIGNIGGTNLYIYTDRNPIRYYDPSGMQETSVDAPMTPLPDDIQEKDYSDPDAGRNKSAGNVIVEPADPNPPSIEANRNSEIDPEVLIPIHGPLKESKRAGDIAKHNWERSLYADSLMWRAKQGFELLLAGLDVASMGTATAVRGASTLHRESIAKKVSPHANYMSLGGGNKNPNSTKIRLLSVTGNPEGGAFRDNFTGRYIENPFSSPSSRNTTRYGVKRNNPADWRQWRNDWDEMGYGYILSESNRKKIAEGRAPEVDETWYRAFPGMRNLEGEKISIHHVYGHRINVPLPKTRHSEAHRGNFSTNPGGPGNYR